MEGAGFPPQYRGWRRRKRNSRIGFGDSGRLVTSPLPKLGASSSELVHVISSL